MKKRLTNNERLTNRCDQVSEIEDKIHKQRRKLFTTPIRSKSDRDRRQKKKGSDLRSRKQNIKIVSQTAEVFTTKLSTLF